MVDLDWLSKLEWLRDGCLDRSANEHGTFTTIDSMFPVFTFEPGSMDRPDVIVCQECGEKFVGHSWELRSFMEKHIRQNHIPAHILRIIDEAVRDSAR